MEQVVEDILFLYFELYNKAAIHAKRVTVIPRDSAFVREFVEMIIQKLQ